MLRELLLAAVVAVVIAVGPFTPNEPGPAALIGVVVGAAVLAVRLRLRAPTAAAQEAEGSSHDVRGGLDPRELLPWAAVLGLWTAAFWPTLYWMWREWTRSVWANDHGIFMPFIVGYLVWSTLRRDSDRSPDASRLGLLLLGAGLALAVVDAVAQTRYLGMAGLLMSLPAFSLITLGRSRTRRLAVPWVLSLLMTPVPFTLSTHLYLRYATARAVEPALRLLGVPVYREDTVIHLSSGPFVVADACSGFSTLYAALAIAAVLFFLTRGAGRRLLVLLAAPILALAANSIRVLALILIAHFIGHWTLETPIHEATGVAAFAVVLVGLLALAREPSSEAPA